MMVMVMIVMIVTIVMRYASSSALGLPDDHGDEVHDDDMIVMRYIQIALFNPSFKFQTYIFR